MSLFTAVTGAAGHASLAETITSELIERFGKDYPLTLSNGEPAQTPLIRLICGFKPKVLSDMQIVTSYINREITSLLSVLNMGQEGEWIEFESKALHAGMLDNLSLEVIDMAQIATFKFPSNSPDTPIVDNFTIPPTPPSPSRGEGEGEGKKPAILCIGHNSITGIEIMQYLDENNLSEKIDLYGLCCMATDMSRYNPPIPPLAKGGKRGFRIAGNQRDQLKFIKSGIANIIVLDSQCIRTDILHHASKMGIPVIATNPECSLGLPDRTGDETEKIVDDLLSQREAGVLIFDKKKIAEVAAETSIRRKKIPNSKFQIPKYKIRIGRGAISDIEIKNVAPPIVMGEIPGIIGFLGCPNYSTPSPSPPYKGGGWGGILEMARALIDRDYIVTTGGRTAIDLAEVDTDGKSLYEETNGRFDAGGFANLGSCVSASHLLGAAIKIASVMLHRPIDGNYKEIADYILNRVGVVIIIWGPMSQKAFATATGANRLGIPVIFGNKGEIYGRMLEGNNSCGWEVTDMRNKREVFAGPTPAHLMTTADSPSEALTLAAKLCMRPNDTSKGRQTKLKNYIELYMASSNHPSPLLLKEGTKGRSGIPDGIHLFVRTKYDMPYEYKDSISHELEKRNWKPAWIPDPTLLPNKNELTLHLK